jgi:predicted PurR-regulated permease PerM
VFGGLWGFWGIFFAIPLATLVKAVINAWPRKVLPAAENVGSEAPSGSEEAPATAGDRG